MQPKVSILIPCYNAQQWVGQAIESALNQTYSNKEVIVVDDGSTDNSLAIIQSFGSNIRWETGANKGGNVARNRLLELSEGEWLQYLDADDYLLPNKINHQIRHLVQVSTTDIFYSPSVFEYCQAGQPAQEVVPIPEPYDPFILLARWFLPQTGSPLWRKQSIVEVGGWKNDQPCCQEHELYLRLLKADKQFVYCSEAGSVYRQWSEETVCKRDMPEVFRQRLAIEDDLEQHLSQLNQLTPERRQAINQARFECARLIWLFDTEWAKRLVCKIHRTHKSFVPDGASAPKLYQLIYWLMGFSQAEGIASARRSLVRR